MNLMEKSSSLGHLEEVIECIHDQDKHLQKIKLPAIPNNPQSIKNLYQSTQGVLEEFEVHFNRCKKYNQAKIHRKYQIIISDLEKEVKTLKQKIKLQQSARPSNQQYVSDLINKMVILREQNERLTQECKQMKLKMQGMQKLQINLNAAQSKETLIPRSNSKHSDHNQSQSLSEAIEKYLILKNEEKLKQQTNSLCNLQKFIKLHQIKIKKWNILQFLFKLQTWTNNLRDRAQIDKNKVKQILKKSPSFSLQKNEQSSVLSAMKPNFKTITSRPTGTVTINDKKRWIKSFRSERKIVLEAI